MSMAPAKDDSQICEAFHIFFTPEVWLLAFKPQLSQWLALNLGQRLDTLQAHLLVF